jgi:hypothetical protein
VGDLDDMPGPVASTARRLRIGFVRGRSSHRDSLRGLPRAGAAVQRSYIDGGVVVE